MVLDPRTGVYVGAIPAAFIDPKWDLMYFVEVIDARSGRFLPNDDASFPICFFPDVCRTRRSF